MNNMYNMTDVLDMLSSGQPNGWAAAYVMYWHATDKTLPFDMCIQHVDAIASKFGTTPRNVPISTDFIAFRLALLDGQKIGAIKALRACTGWGLKETKDAVESFLGDGRRITLHSSDY
jgi:hypothetical protein